MPNTKKERLLKFQKRLNRNKIERILAQELKNKDIPFVQNYIVRLGKYTRFVDFAIKKFKVFIEVDGPEHRTLEGQASDMIRHDEIQRQFPKYQFIRFTNREISRDVRRVVRTIRGLLKQRKRFSRKLIPDYDNTPWGGCLANAAVVKNWV